MHTEAPKNYMCPICLGVEGIENEKTLIRKNDILFQDEDAMVFIASYFIEGNDGHLIVVPTKHYENMFELPTEIGSKVFEAAKKYAAVMKEAYNCGGVTTLQNNGRDAGQHAFHYHLHLFPRYAGDTMYENMNSKIETTVEERKVFVDKILNVIQ